MRIVMSGNENIKRKFYHKKLGRDQVWKFYYMGICVCPECRKLCSIDYKWCSKCEKVVVIDFQLK